MFFISVIFSLCFRFMLKSLSNILAYLLGTLSDEIYVNVSGKDQTHYGSVNRPCRSLSFAINNVSCHNDTIQLMANSNKQIRFTLQNPIIIKHSLTVSKFPPSSQKPLITYDHNVKRNWKEFYAFTIFRYVLSPEILTLNIKSINFNVNILTTLSGDISGFHLSFSISGSIISCLSHAVNFSDDESGHEKVSIQIKDLVIQSGAFKFENIRERCEAMERIKNTIEMNNITIRTTGNIELCVHGCFNVSIEKLMCSNITWKKQNLFTFTGGILNVKNVLIKNVLANVNTKYNKSEAKALFLIHNSVGEIQNILIKDSAGMSSKRSERLSAVLIVQNSIVKVLNIKMEGNFFLPFARAGKSSIYVENMTLSENNFTAKLLRVKKSNVTLYEINFYRNKIGGLLYVKRNSKVLIANNSLTGNEILENAYLISKSCMIINITNFHANKIKNPMVAKSQSNIFINNLTLTNNYGSRTTYNEFINNLGYTFLVFYSELSGFRQYSLTKRNVLSTVCDLSGNSAIQLNNVAFIQNKLMATFLRIKSNSAAVIQNNTLTENNFSWTVFDIEENSRIQLNHVTFIRNRLMCNLFRIKLNSSAIIQNNKLTENNVSYKVYEIIENSIVRLYYVTFTRNEFMGSLLWMYSNSSAFIQNNTLIENDVFQTVYSIKRTSTIKMNHVTFIRNRLMGSLLWMYSDSSAIIKNNILRENNLSFTVYFIEKNSNIQLINGTFIQNNLVGKLLNMLSSCSAKLINNIMVGNSLDWIIFAHSSSLEIKKIFIKDNMFSHLISAFQCYVRFESMQIQENDITHSMIYVEDCAGGMASTSVDNSDKFLASALKTKCTYLVYRYCLFEMTRTEIIWSSVVPVPARPIIQLSGNITLSNVKILVNSRFETEILQYSTKDVLLSVNGELRITTNVYNISSFFIGCTKARVKRFTQAGTFRCIPCPPGTYSLINEPFNTSSNFQSKNVTLRENSNFTCYDCPAGGNCTASIKSKSNKLWIQNKGPPS